MKHRILRLILVSSAAALADDLIVYGLRSNDTNPDPGDFVTVSWTARTANDIYVGSTEQGVMLSRDNQITRDDQLLELEPLGALGGLLYNASSPETRTITIPSEALPGEVYDLGAYADYGRDRSETNESNNGSDGVLGSFLTGHPDGPTRKWSIPIDGQRGFLRLEVQRRR